MGKNRKALRGLGTGLAQVGEMLLSDHLARMREAALMRLRAEYDAPEREERKRQFDEEVKLRREGEASANRRHKETLKAQRDIASIRTEISPKDRYIKVEEEVEVFDKDGNQLFETKTDPNTQQTQKVPVFKKVEYVFDLVEKKRVGVAQAGDEEGDSDKSFLPSYLEPGKAPASPNVAPAPPSPARPTIPPPTQAMTQRERSGQEFRRGLTDPLFAGAQPVVEGLLDTPQDRRPVRPTSGRFY